MPTSVPDLILCDAQAATGVGLVIGFGEEMRYANKAGVNRNAYKKRLKVRVRLLDTTSGASATIKIQESADNSSYTDVYSFVFSAIPTGSTQAASAKLITTNKRYVRANVTALTGGSAPVIDAYATVGTFGQ